ncbi:MAG: nuclear transport factor 2 family protein [Desulfuromonadaceae bacterium]|nr:nuclear transport factor 2 family protein [Desulfuromonadaceae bacterium]
MTMTGKSAFLTTILLALLLIPLTCPAQDHGRKELESNKRIVKEFYDLAFNQKKPKEAAAKFFGASYTQHYPLAADGPQAFVEFATWFTQANPGLRVDIKKIVAEGNLVTLFSHFNMKPGDRGLAAFDMFRLEKGKLVEHWGFDIPVPEKTTSGNSLF